MNVKRCILTLDCNCIYLTNKLIRRYTQVSTFDFRAVCRIFHILSKTHKLSQHVFRIHILWNGMSYKKSLFSRITFLVFKGEVCKNDKGLELNGSVIHNEYLLLWFLCQISTLHGVMVNIYTILYRYIYFYHTQNVINLSASYLICNVSHFSQLYEHISKTQISNLEWDTTSEIDI